MSTMTPGPPSTSLAAVTPRTSVLGGQTRERKTFGALSAGAVGALALLGVGWIVAIIVAPGGLALVVIFGGGAVGVGLVRAMTHVNDEGDGWLRAVSLALRYRLQSGVRILGRDVIRHRVLWIPQVGAVPGAIGQLRELDVATGAGTVSLVHHPDRRRGFEKGYFTGSLEVIGGGDGIQEIHEVNSQGIRFGRILKNLASPRVPVDQVDFDTRVLATDPGEYRRHVESLLKAEIGAELEESMRELTEIGAAASESYRSFVTVRMPLDQVISSTMGREDLDGVVDAATEALRLAAERLMRGGYDVRSVMSPRRVGAFIRHTYVPSYGVDQLDGLETVADAFAFFGYDHGQSGRSLRVEAGDHGEWYHAVASIPMDGWPLAEVGVRWLEGLVTDTERAVIRTVRAQHRLIPRREARDRAAIGRTLDEADLHRQAKREQTSTGELEEQASAADRLLRDLRTDGAAGDLPAVRILVSGRSRHELEDARSVIEGAVDDMSIQRLRWYDKCHDLAMVTLLPMGRGVKLS